MYEKGESVSLVFPQSFFHLFPLSSPSPFFPPHLLALPFHFILSPPPHTKIKRLRRKGRNIISLPPLHLPRNSPPFKAIKKLSKMRSFSLDSRILDRFVRSAAGIEKRIFLILNYVRTEEGGEGADKGSNNKNFLFGRHRPSRC